MLHQVVATLVQLVDGAFNRCDFRIVCAGDAGLVFFVPELKIGKVLLLDGHVETGRISVEARRGVVPAAGSLVVETHDFFGIDHSV